MARHRQIKSVKGKFIGNERGFGFVDVENGPNIFISPNMTLGALHGDEVEAEPENRTDENEHPYGKIVEIIRRSPMLGTYRENGFVSPVENKIPYVFSVPPKTVSRFGLVDGHRVVFSVDKRHNPSETLSPCFITEVLGHINDPGVDVLSLVRQAGVPFEFSDEVMAEAAALPDEVSNIVGRLDLRDELIFTIDGDSTKDIDDAVSISEAQGRFRLGVHIADVAHYVRENSALDTSAFNRGTSVYLADRVIPMLPHKLSNGICSLHPNVDRLTVSCIMTVDTRGDVLEYEIAESVIRSKKRWTYQKVQALLDKPEKDEWKPLFETMDRLRGILRAKRERRGALDFDLPETKIRVDESGCPVSAEPYSRNRATGIIEEFMILCNETIAAHFLAREAPFVYRTHEPPSAEKIAGLVTFTKNFGIDKKPQSTKPSVLRQLLASAQNTPAAYAVSTAVLRALPQAYYTPDKPTHFGLASKAYCHFTSPIRRYADLQVHRIIKRLAPPANPPARTGKPRGDSKPGTVRYAIKNAANPEQLSAICAQCSRTERVAEALEREVAALKMAQFMENKEGQAFDAIVTGVNAWGICVMLKNTAEGVVPVANLRRHNYKFYKERGVYETKKRDCLRHGSSIKVRLIRADVEERKLTFVIESL